MPMIYNKARSTVLSIRWRDLDVGVLDLDPYLNVRELIWTLFLSCPEIGPALLRNVVARKSTYGSSPDVFK